MIAAGACFEGTLELALIRPSLFPVALDMSEEVIRTRKAAVAELTNVWPGGGLQVCRLVCREVQEE